MSTNTKLSIKSTNYADEKKTVTDTINYVNPNISNATALELAQRLSALTMNSYKSTEKIETTELDSIIPKAQRTVSQVVLRKAINQSPTLNLTLENDKYICTISKAEYTLNAAFALSIATTGNLNPITLPKFTLENATFADYFIASNLSVQYKINFTEEATLITGTVKFPEDSTYEELTINLEITLTE